MPGEVKKLSGFVGFANLPNQVHRKSIKQGFQFTLLVVGESGLGKATFVNSLFNTQIYPKKTPKTPTKDTIQGVQIQGYSADLEEGGVKLKLNVLDAVGYGDLVNNADSWEPILRCVEERYDAYLDQERRVNRKHIVDNRIHCCLYFISPTGHSLKALDIEFLKRLHERVNIIPVIAKADTLSDEEKVAFKKRILADLEFHKIGVYRIESEADDDAESKKRDAELEAAMPFAVIGSDKEYEVNGKKVRARKYPWGLIEVENETHSDFIKLRNLMVKSHMEDLRSKTVEVLYENYRTERLVGDLGGTPTSGSKKGDLNPLAAFEEEKKSHEAKMKKMEKEMKQVFEQKVKEKETRLQQSEEKLVADHNEMKSQLEKQIKELDEKKKALEEAQRAAEKKPKKKSGLF